MQLSTLSNREVDWISTSNNKIDNTPHALVFDDLDMANSARGSCAVYGSM